MTLIERIKKNRIQRPVRALNKAFAILLNLLQRPGTLLYRYCDLNELNNHIIPLQR